MLIYAVDDEKSILAEMKDAIVQAVDSAEVHTFTRGKAALEAIQEGEKPDVVFTDIEMPGMAGIEFAIRLKEVLPDIRIIFTTGYEQYAVDAFKIKAYGYLLKPLTVEDIREELKTIQDQKKEPDDKLVVRCFGHFSVFWKGEPVIFTRKQSKELFAYLIDREGDACTAGEIGLALWESESSGDAEMHRVRNLISDLRNTLKEIGMEDAIIRKHRQVAIRRDMVDCDYYRLLDGDVDALNSYHGNYMVDYSWAEITGARLQSSYSGL